MNGVISVLLVGGLFGSLCLWYGLIIRWGEHRPALDRVETIRLPPPPMAVLAALAWMGLNLFDQWLAAGRTELPEPTPSLVLTSAVISLGVLVMLAGLLFLDGRWKLRDAGVRLSEWPSSLRIGSAAFLAAILPTGLALLASFSFRSRETQHRLLQVLQEHPDPLIIGGLGVTAVAIAPLCEELLFRVTLQTWLTSRCGASIAIPVIALLFAAVHGWRDSLALLPLSLILGYVYDRRHDYLAVVTTHGLFNLTNLTLALLSDPSEIHDPSAL